jgi:hypothetical protein
MTSISLGCQPQAIEYRAYGTKKRTFEKRQRRTELRHSSSLTRRATKQTTCAPVG